MALVDLKKIADKIEIDFYGKIYDYVFKKLKRDVSLESETAWSSDGVWFGVYGQGPQVLYEETVWWGVEGAVLNKMPILTQMRVKVPKDVLVEIGYCEIGYRFKNNIVLKLWKDRHIREKLKTIVGKAIYDFMTYYDGKLKITLGYDALHLVEANTIEELLIEADLYSVSLEEEVVSSE